MSDVRVLWIRCSECGAEGPIRRLVMRDWDGKTYGLACGHDVHLNEAKGGAESWIAADEPAAEDAGKPKEGGGESNSR